MINGEPAVVPRGNAVDVREFGAIGNGSTDDTAAIQAAANAAVAGDGTLLFPQGYTFMVNPAINNGNHAIIALGGSCEVRIEEGATVRVMTSTTAFGQIFGPSAVGTDMTGVRYTGGGTIDGNSAARIAAAVVPAPGGTQCEAIGLGIGSHQKVLGLRFTNFDSVWVVSGSSSAAGNASDCEVAYCQFDNLGNTVSAQQHDSSTIYLDAIGMKVHHNVFWVGSPGAPSFTTNYGARTAIECHGSGQHVHHNTAFGLQWGGQLNSSSNSWTDTDQFASRNAIAAHWHDNSFQHAAVGIQIVPYYLQADGHYYGLEDVNIHHNSITLDPAIWAVGTGGGILNNGVVLVTSQQSGSVTRLRIAENDISITPNNSAMNTFSWAGASAMAAHISLQLGGTSTITAKDWTISGNTSEGALYAGVFCNAWTFDGLRIERNAIRDFSLYPASARAGIEVSTTATTAGTNQIKHARIAGNVLADDQGAAIHPYGYTAATGGAVVFTNAGDAEDYLILDNSYNANNSAARKAVSGFTGAPTPFVRAFDQYTLTTPDGNYQAGSTITLISERNVGNNAAITYVQSTTGAGSTWTQQPVTQSGAPTIRGQVGSRYHRTDTPGTANQREYICTVAGADGAATWVGIL